MIKICISVTSHALDPPPTLSQTVTPSRTPSPLERDVLYGWPPGHKSCIIFTVFYCLCACSYMFQCLYFVRTVPNKNEL